MRHATLNTQGCCDGTGQEYWNATDDPEYTGPLTFVKACTDRACLARREAAWDHECETGEAT